jgi:antitoxin YefM
MPHITFTDLRKNPAGHLDRVEADRAELIVTRHNHEPVVILPPSEWESMQETPYLLSSPANREHLRTSIAQIDAGRLTEHELIDP